MGAAKLTPRLAMRASDERISFMAVSPGFRAERFDGHVFRLPEVQRMMTTRACEGRPARSRGLKPHTDQALAPPSTVKVEPVMYCALGLARNATALAMSSGAPKWPTAMNWRSVSPKGP